MRIAAARSPARPKKISAVTTYRRPISLWLVLQIQPINPVGRVQSASMASRANSLGAASVGIACRETFISNSPDNQSARLDHRVKVDSAACARRVLAPMRSRSSQQDNHACLAAPLRRAFPDCQYESDQVRELHGRLCLELCGTSRIATSETPRGRAAATGFLVPARISFARLTSR